MKRPAVVTNDFFNGIVKKSKRGDKREQSNNASHQQEFGKSPQQEKEESVALQLREEAVRRQRPVFAMLKELVTQKSSAIVMTSAVAEAEADYEQSLHHTSDSTHYDAIQPCVKLWAYQEEAVTFLANRENDSANIGCRGLLLCDDMGLGKTLETLTFIFRDIQRLYRETGNRFNGVTLIVMPKMLVDTWVDEITSAFPPNTLHYIKMVGNHNDVIPNLLHLEGCVDIIFTTYPVVSVVYKTRHRIQEDENDDELDENDKHRYNVLFDINYRRVVTDEGHEVAGDPSNLTFRAMKSLKARSKWVNTGTPIRNSYANMYACLEFIEVPGITEKNYRIVSTQDKVSLREILDKVMIRRLKEEVAMSTLDGSLIPLNRMDKKIEFIDFECNQERILYLLYAEHGMSKVKGYCNKDNNNKLPIMSEKNINITSIILFMRQCCTDYRIVKKPIIPNGMLLMPVKDNDCRKVTTFNEKLFYDESCHFEHVDADNVELEYKAFMLNRNTTFVYNNRNTYTWRPYHNEDPFLNLADCKDSRIAYKSVYDTIYAIRHKHHRNATLDEVLAILFKDVNRDDGDEVQFQIERVSGAYKHIIDRLLPVYGTKTMRILRYIQHERDDPSDKVIVFSDSVAFLKLMQTCLEEHDIGCCVITGGKNKNTNSERLYQFQHDANKHILLMSIKVGCGGLNLPYANHVIFASRWWNPYIELQGEARIQRIGQNKVMHIRHFIIKDTMEEYVLDLSNYKKDISHELIERDADCGDDDELDGLDEDCARKRLSDFVIKVMRDY